MQNKESRWPYPKYDDIEAGFRVSWYYYKKLKDAKKASEIAKDHADWCSARGFDFGYCYPSAIEKITEGKHKGMYSVCIP